METALRVLSAIIDYRVPDAGDIEILRQIAPRLADGPVDELARHVIQTSRAHL